MRRTWYPQVYATTTASGLCEQKTNRENVVTSVIAPSLCSIQSVPPKPIISLYTIPKKLQTLYCREQRKMYKTLHRLRSSWDECGRLEVDPRLLVNRLLQLTEGSAPPRRLESDEAVPCSRSPLFSSDTSPRIPDEEDSLAVSEAWAWPSSSLSSIYGS
jgi:hypothetical protein